MGNNIVKQGISNSLSDWYQPFVEFLFRYPYFKTAKSDISLNLSVKNYLQKVFPNWKKNYHILDEKQSNRKKQLKLISNCNDDFFFMVKSKGTELLSFLYHVRNAIAHGNVTFNGTYVEMRDYYLNPSNHSLSRTASAYFRIKRDELEDFFSELNNI